MTEDRSPPPKAEACLCRRYSSSQKGGTLIAEDVTDLATHERRLCNPDGYRPEGCANCHRVLHVHDYRQRLLVAEAEAAVTRVVRYRCPPKQGGCGATWQVLPALLARHLWRSWRVVEASTQPEPRPKPPVPERTRRRWRARLCACAWPLVLVLITATSAALDRVVEQVGAVASRQQLLAIYSQQTATAAGQRLSKLAAVVHRLEPEVRVM